MKSFNPKTTIWSERYKPQTLEDVILPKEISHQLIGFVQNENLPNIGMWSPEPGLGKSSTANAIIHDLKCEALWINASLENGIDTLRSKIARFASQQTFSDSCKFKVVVMDECLEENEKVQLSDGAVRLKDLKRGEIYQCKSMNLKTHEIEDDTCEVVSDHFDDIYEVELEDGRKVKVTANHPFIVNQNNEYIQKSIQDGLCENDEVVTDDSFNSRA